MKGISAIQKAGCTSWNVSSLPFAVYSLCLIIRSGFENALVFRLSTFTVYHTIPAFSCHKFVTNLPKTATEKKLSTISSQKHQGCLYRYRSRSKHHASQYFQYFIGTLPAKSNTAVCASCRILPRLTINKTSLYNLPIGCRQRVQ